MLVAAWQYRQFILSAIRAELKGRFARSKLGGLWFILHPLAQSAIYAIVLSEVLGARLPNAASSAAYPIYLVAGMAAWGLFMEIVNRCMTIFVEYAGTLKKIAFPRICLPLIVWGGALVNHALLLAASAVVFLALGHTPTLAWASVLLGAVLISGFAFGLGILIGVFNVFMRDFAQFFGVVMQIWFWLTPVVYSADVLPERFRAVFALNPMTPLVAIYQNAILRNQWPDLAPLAAPALIGAILLLAAMTLFKRASAELVDAL